MRNEGLARLYVRRKQLVMAVTYRSSVTLPVWAVSHQPVPLSNLGRAPKPSISLLTRIPSLPSVPFVACHLAPLSSIFPPSSRLDNSHFSYFCPLAHIARRCLPKLQLWRGPAVHQRARLICLSCVDALLFNIQLQNYTGPASNHGAMWRPRADNERKVMEY